MMKYFIVVFLVIVSLFLCSFNTLDESNSCALIYVDASQSTEKDGLSTAAFSHLKQQVEKLKAEGEIYFYGSKGDAPVIASAADKILDALTKYTTSNPDEPDLAYDAIQIKEEFSYLLSQHPHNKLKIYYYLTDNTTSDIYSSANFPSNGALFKLLPQELALFSSATFIEVNIIYSNNTSSVDAKKLNDALNFQSAINNNRNISYTTLDQ